MTAEGLAKKLNLDVKTVQTKLDNLGSRWWVSSQEGRYSSFSGQPPIFEFSTLSNVPEKERRAQWLDWYRTEEHQKWLHEESRRRLSKVKRRKAGMRILPAHRALTASPDIKPEQILWFEDLSEVFKTVTKIFVKRCPCRLAYGTCDAPLESCINFSYDENTPELVTRLGGKEISAAEATAIVEDTEDRAMLNITANRVKLGEFCTCCPCCCGILYPYFNYGDTITKEATLAPSRFRAVIHREACSGCQTCVERCHFDAIEMQKMPNSKKLKANITNEKCMGCGLCVIKCPQNAITLELIRPPEHIPAESEEDPRVKHAISGNGQAVKNPTHGMR
jgi:Pyruvate/2-oxoacid:ferredoxin oxidoreductase delta subunit